MPRLATPSLLAALLALGCYAEPPPPAMATDLGGCHPGAYGARSELACAEDADCRLCVTDDARCGRLVAARETRNEDCVAPDLDECGGASPACCDGRCVRSLGPPAF